MSPVAPRARTRPRRAPRQRTASLLLALGLLATAARAAVPEPEPPPPVPAAAARDTSGFLPRWLHLHASVGFGWISSPRFVRERYQGGQDFEAGLEARPAPGLRLRVSGEYQVLPAVGRATYQIVTFQDLEGAQLLDTLAIDWYGRGWLGAARAEVQWRTLPRAWLLAGVGRGYIEAGMRPYRIEQPGLTVDVEFPGSSGWAWIGMLGARYEFDVFGPLLGAEVRWSTLDRPQDRLRTWSVRIGWQGK